MGTSPTPYLLAFLDGSDDVEGMKGKESGNQVHNEYHDYILNVLCGRTEERSEEAINKDAVDDHIACHEIDHRATHTVYYFVAVIG